MATSETLLSVVAIRLAVLVVVALVARTAAGDRPGSEARCVQARMAVDMRAPLATKPEPDQVLRDMKLHD
jgi:hypothetical protein